MPKTKRPLWECPRCGRRFANRNQWHGCTNLSLADCFSGKTDKTVALFRAFEEAVRACGPVRVHPNRTRIGFIARMTFAGARLLKDAIEVGLYLPYRSDSPRFHKYHSYGTGCVHYVRIDDPGLFDDEFLGWLTEAYRLGQQEEVKAAPPPAAAPSKSIPKKKAKGRRRAGKLFYLHWNEEELLERIAPLCAAGHEVRTHWSPGDVARLGDFLPDIFVISLDRLPSHGRAYARWFWEAKTRRHLPIVFAGGQPDKVAVARQHFPNAVFCSTNEMADVVDQLLSERPV
jgi:hypothetical protein